MKPGDVLNGGTVTSGKIYTGGGTRHALQDQQGTSEPPAAFEAAKEFKEGFSMDSMERRLLSFEKSYRHEDDWQHMPYQLSNEGVLTTGYGHVVPEKELTTLGFDKKNLKKKGSKLKSRHEFKDFRIPESKAQEWFLKDVAAARSNAIRIAGNQGVDFESLPEGSQNALGEMAYQMGANGLMKFPSMWEGYRRGDLGMVQREMLDSNWHNSQTPARAENVTALLDSIDPEDFPTQVNDRAKERSLKWRSTQAKNSPGLGDY